MLKSKVEEMIGKNVKVVTFDNDVFTGTLHKTDEVAGRKPGAYYTSNRPHFAYKSSHIKIIEEIK